MDNTDLNKKLKLLIIFLGATFIFGVIILITALLLRNNIDKNNEEETIFPPNSTTTKVEFFGDNCSPTHIEYKENYIVIHSKICKKILIINTSTGREIYKTY